MVEMPSVVMIMSIGNECVMYLRVMHRVHPSHKSTKCTFEGGSEIVCALDTQNYI